LVSRILDNSDFDFYPKELLQRKNMQALLKKLITPKYWPTPFRSIVYVNRYTPDLAEERVPVYKSTVFASVLGLTEDQEFFEKLHANTQLRSHYLSLMPAISVKELRFGISNFVVQMDLMPKSEAVELTLLTPAGLFKKIVRTENFVPVNWDEYRFEHSSPF
jgi:hypothetical protein